MSSPITGIFKAMAAAFNDTAELSAPHLEDLGRRFFRNLKQQGLIGEQTALTDLLHDREPQNADPTLVEAASKIITHLTSQAKQALQHSADLRPLHEKERPNWAAPLEKTGSSEVTSGSFTGIT